MVPGVPAEMGGIGIYSFGRNRFCVFSYVLSWRYGVGFLYSDASGVGGSLQQSSPLASYDVNKGDIWDRPEAFRQHDQCICAVYIVFIGNVILLFFLCGRIFKLAGGERGIFVSPDPGLCFISDQSDVFHYYVEGYPIRHLCGAVHSVIVRYARSAAKWQAEQALVVIIYWGQLRRMLL